jgi:hypothetical protein
MKSYMETLKRVGAVLVLVGMADVAYMAYCIGTGKSYSSGLNIFAVIAGVFLWRGHLGAAHLVTRFAALLLTGSIGTLLFLAPLLRPIDLWATQLRLNPIASILGVVVTATMVGLLAWTYRELRSAPVIQALQSDGRSTAAPRGAMAIGVIIPLTIAIVFYFTFGGEIGAKAIDLARAQYGVQYKYAPMAISQAGNHVSAKLTAYNDHEIKEVTVEWDR